MKGYAYSEAVLPEGHELDFNSAEATQNPLLSTEQQLALMRLAKVDDPEARQQVVAHMLHLVFNIAKRYGDHGVALLDLFREGNRGLIHALENFDIEGGFRFAVYARQCIRHHIERTILSQCSPSFFAEFQATPFHGDQSAI